MDRPSDESNIILIGMPGVGKSTVGVLLAKATGRSFIDTDLVIQAGEGQQLQQIIDSHGLDFFCRVEERYVLRLNCRRHVIATGGSVVYSAAAMGHLKSAGLVVHLDAPIEIIEHRIENLSTRGLVAAPDQTLECLYRQRQPLYRRWADVIVDCRGLDQDQVVTRILQQM